MGTSVSGADQGGSRFTDPGEDLHGGGSGFHSLRVIDGVNDTTHRNGFGYIPPQDGLQADRETTSYMTVWWMGVSPFGGSDYRCGNT